MDREKTWLPALRPLLRNACTAQSQTPHHDQSTDLEAAPIGPSKELHQSVGRGHRGHRQGCALRWLGLTWRDGRLPDAQTGCNRSKSRCFALLAAPALL